MQTTEVGNTDAAILARVLQAGKNDLPPAAAKALLKLGFTEQDRDRMHELAVKNQDGNLTEAERRELESYCRVGRLLDLLAARARSALAKNGRSA
jgi:hypothetical protein